VQRIVFAVLIFLLFIIMAVRVYTPEYVNLPPSLKSLLQLRNTPQSKLPGIEEAHTSNSADQTREDNGMAIDQPVTQNN